MPFKKGEGGRKKGVPNKMTMSAKAAFAAAFDECGGAAGLATWAAANRTEFYKLYSKLIPVSLTSDPDNPLVTRVEYVVIDPTKNAAR